MLLSSRLLAASRTAGALRPAVKHAFSSPLAVTSSSPRRFVGAKAESSESKDSPASNPSTPPPPRTRPGAQAPLKVEIFMRKRFESLEMQIQCT